MPKKAKARPPTRAREPAATLLAAPVTMLVGAEVEALGVTTAVLALVIMVVGT